MKTKEEIKKWILENCVDSSGDIDLTNLDFTGFRGSVHRGGWKVDGDLWQQGNKVVGHLHQNNNFVKCNLYQNANKVHSNLHQNHNEVWGNLYQGYNEVNCDLLQKNSKVYGKTYNDFKHHKKVMRLDEKNEWVEDKRFAKQIEDMTKKELIKMIKELIK